VSRPALGDKLHPAQQPARFAFLRARVLVPRFAVVLLAAAIVAASAGIVAMRAQSESRPLWFQFGLHLKGLEPMPGTLVAQAGYDKGMVTWMAADQIFGTHIAVSEVKEGRVQLGIRARRLSPGEAASGFRVKKELGNLQSHAFAYVPGEAFEIPVEGAARSCYEDKLWTTNQRSRGACLGSRDPTNSCSPTRL